MRSHRGDPCFVGEIMQQGSDWEERNIRVHSLAVSVVSDHQPAILVEGIKSMIREKKFAVPSLKQRLIEISLFFLLCMLY